MLLGNEPRIILQPHLITTQMKRHINVNDEV